MSPRSERAGTRAFLELLYAGYPDGHVELASGRRAPDGRLVLRARRRPGAWLPVGDSERIGHTLRAQLARGEESFLGVVPRLRPDPVSAAVGPSRVVWVDLDRPARAHHRRAHLEVASGRGVHLYWLLEDAMAPEEAERANRRLARHLGADPAATDRLRLLRAPGSPNPRGERARLLVARPELPRHRLAELLDGLPPEPAPRARLLQGRDEAVGSPAGWLRALAGAEPGPGGWMSCPLPDHEDRTPSFLAYPDAARGWFCFGCARGGGLYDLASLLAGGPWGPELRGEAFRAARRSALAALGRTDDPSLSRRRP